MLRQHGRTHGCSVVDLAVGLSSAASCKAAESLCMQACCHMCAVVTFLHCKGFAGRVVKHAKASECPFSFWFCCCAGTSVKHSSIMHMTLGRVLQARQLTLEQRQAIQQRCSHWSQQLKGTAFKPEVLWYKLLSNFCY